MNPIEELIQKYEKKKSETERFLNHRYYNKIEWFESWVDEDIKIFSEIIEDLKNLPNELRAVNRNEQAKEICPRCRETTEISVKPIKCDCLVCGATWQIG